jgi:purine-nucleoside phosphorylase
MSLEQSITDLNKNISTLIGILSKGALKAMPEDEITPAPASTSVQTSTVDAPPADTKPVISDKELIQAAVAYADKHGGDIVKGLVNAADIAPQVEKITKVPAEKRALLMQRLKEGL